MLKFPSVLQVYGSDDAEMLLLGNVRRTNTTRIKRAINATQKAGRARDENNGRNRQDA